MDKHCKVVHPKFTAPAHPSFGAPTGYTATAGPGVAVIAPSIIPTPSQVNPTISLGGYMANPNCTKCHGTGLTPKGSKCHKCFHY